MALANVDRDFSITVRRALIRKGVMIMSSTAIPDMSSPMPWANADRGYKVNDNGTGRILTYAQVVEMSR